MESKSDSVVADKTRARAYSLELVEKTIAVLETLRRQGELRLTDVVQITGMDKSTTFRILYTLQEHGYVLRDPRTKKFYIPLGHRRYRIGYAQPMAGHRFGDIVTKSLVEEAERRGIELVVLDNRWDPEEAVKNAHRLVEQRVDFAIEFQVYDEVAPEIAEIFAKAEIPTMTVDVFQPGAIYFGPNNYAVGVLCGEALARHAMRHWHGRLDRLIFIDYRVVGPQGHRRFIGALKGIQRTLRHFGGKQAIDVDAESGAEGAYRAMGEILRSVSGRDRLAITGINNDAVWGALRAVRDARRERLTTVMGISFDAAPSFIEEMRKPDGLLIGSVAWFPEKYGPVVLSLVTRCLNGEQIPPEVYVDHVLVTRENLDAILVAAKHIIEPPVAGHVRDTLDEPKVTVPRPKPVPALRRPTAEGGNRIGLQSDIQCS